MSKLANALILIKIILLQRILSNSAQERNYTDLFFYDAAGPRAECFQCNLRTNKRSYTGRGFADFKRKGSWIEFQINIQQMTNLLVVRYSAGGSDRPVDVYIEEQFIGSLKLEKTINWDTWHLETIQFTPRLGSFKVRLEANESRGPNVDMIILLPIENKKTSEETNSKPRMSPPPKSPSNFPTNSPITPNLSPIVPLPPSGPPTSSPRTTPVYIQQPFKQKVLLRVGESFDLDEFKSSENGKFKFGLETNGILTLKDDGNNVIWKADSQGAKRAHLQKDGNFLTRLPNGKSNWKTGTCGNDEVTLIIDNGGQVAIWSTRNTTLWLAGIPRGKYNGPPNTSLQFPLRGAFYYAWFPETWSINGKPVSYRPILEKYRNGNPLVQKAHIDALNYIHVDIAIASWWGIDETLERARLTNLLDKSIGTKLKWTVYHEMEMYKNSSWQEIRNDLDYLKKWYAWHPSWAHIDNRPVIFVYNKSNCDVAKRWSEASANAWYVVLKLFTGFKQCSFQPDSWHQYGPASAVIHNKGHSFAISPGFKRADGQGPYLPRVSESSFKENVKKMVDSGENWQLVTTFNEWGEGTAVEAAYDWGGSANSQGIYMDALHEIHHLNDKNPQNIFSKL